MHEPAATKLVPGTCTFCRRALLLRAGARVSTDNYHRLAPSFCTRWPPQGVAPCTASLPGQSIIYPLPSPKLVNPPPTETRYFDPPPFPLPYFDTNSSPSAHRLPVSSLPTVLRPSGILFGSRVRLLGLSAYNNIVASVRHPPRRKPLRKQQPSATRPNAHAPVVPVSHPVYLHVCTHVVCLRLPLWRLLRGGIRCGRLAGLAGKRHTDALCPQHT